MGKVEFTVVNGGNIVTPRGFTAGGLHCGLKIRTATIWARFVVR